MAVNVADKPSSSVSDGEITKITILNNGYQTLKSMTYTFDPADLNKTYTHEFSKILDFSLFPILLSILFLIRL